MSVNKHEVMRDWVDEFLGSHGLLYFENADAEFGVRVLVPNYGDYVNRTDILGNKYKSYSFVFVGYETIDPGTSDVNIRNMQLFDDFVEWCETQKANNNFPDFGTNCSDYDIIILQNMANMSAMSEDYLAKYMLGVRIDYTEEG
ncbi:MAG: hypothetical protein IKP50_00505 [Bacilli bacterium]|nr:hypothetical protein [Bacilli bacterium]